MNKKYNIRSTITIVFILILWQLIALLKNNEFIIPYPMHVVYTMIQQIFSKSFYETLFYTITRGIIGLSISFIFGIIMAYISYKYKVINEMFYPLLLLIRSIPNISYILIVLVVFSRTNAVIIILFLILFPIIYTNIYSALQNIDFSFKDVLKLYPEKELYCIRKVYLPLLKPTIEASLLSGISLAFKVGVMAEIIGGMQIGIGRELNLCRLNFDMIGMFAWTGWMILLLVCMDKIIKIIINHNKKVK